MRKTQVVTLVVGDWSHDGHGKTTNVMIKSNLTAKQIDEAYDLGKAVVGIDLYNDICSDYQDIDIPADVYAKYIAAGYPAEKNDETGEPYGVNDLDSRDTYVSLYLYTVKLGNVAFEYTEIPTYKNQVNIGGYGLFD